jgi:hypothetical protein
VLTRSDELTGTRVTATLERLAERRVSGIMEIDGNPAGTIYLNHGQITFAQASWIPDLSARLLGALRLSAASRELITGRTGRTAISAPCWCSGTTSAAVTCRPSCARSWWTLPWC